MKIGVVQTNTQNNTLHNLAHIEAAVDKLADEGAELITLPETFTFLGTDQEMREHAEPLDGPSLTRLRNKACDKKLFIHCGSLLERRGDRIFNTSVVFNQHGEQVARYSKIHLFDIEVPGGIVYRESDIVTAGEDVVTFDCMGVTVGLSICYDIRFPELFRQLAAMGASLLLTPAVFTLMTGKDHWEPLLRARAIENLCYVAAAGNWGICPPKYNSWGHSMVINPWGTILAQAPDYATTFIAELDFDYLHAVRDKLPALQHRRHDIFRRERLS